MSYELPVHGEQDWDVKLNASIEAVKATADAAETPAGATAKAGSAQSAAEATAAAALATHTGNTSNPHSVTKTQVGLGSVDNTADVDKPVSTATQTALDLKANLASPTFTGTVSGITKSMVGLGNVDNTSDASKPVSTATQTALDAKADLTRTINAQTGTSYTLVAGDAGDFVTMTNASASTLTVPPNSSVAFAVGTVIEGAQLGAGQVTLTPGSGVTINGAPGLKVADQYGTFGLLKTATDTWLAFGRLSA